MQSGKLWLDVKSSILGLVYTRILGGRSKTSYKIKRVRLTKLIIMEIIQIYKLLDPSVSHPVA